LRSKCDLFSVAEVGEDEVKYEDAGKQEAAFGEGGRTPFFVMDLRDNVRGRDIDEESGGEREGDGYISFQCAAEEIRRDCSGKRGSRARNVDEDYF